MEGSAGDPGGCLAIKTSRTVCVALSEDGSRSLRWSTPLCFVSSEDVGNGVNQTM